MIVIENKNKIRFFDKNKELTLREGFKQLESIYHNEPLETKKIIDRLREKYLKA